MYYYLYDTYLSESRYDKVIDRIKTRLLDLDINGKHEKLTLLKSVDELVADEVKRGVSTVVAIGNDKSFLKLINVAAKYGITLGMIPIGDDNFMAKALGIPNEEIACDVIAARKVLKFDLGKLQDNYFFTSLVADKNLQRLSISKDTFKIIPSHEASEVELCNFHYAKHGDLPDAAFDKCLIDDGKLELMIKIPVKEQGWLRSKTIGSKVDSIFQSRRFEIKSFEYLPVVLDGIKVVKTPQVVEVEPHKLSVIVGKDRLVTERNV